MNILFVVLVALLAILMAIALRCIDDRFETVIGLHNATNVNIETIIKTSNTNTKNIMTHVEANKNRSLNNAEEIENITAKMEEIIADIHRLDEEVQTIDKSEREIRSYYINFREPAGVPNGGVPWASDYKCFDDMTTEEKIDELSTKANIYHELIGKGSTADDVKYMTEYNKCIVEIQKLQGENNG